jgi:hypothetical protein
MAFIGKECSYGDGATGRNVSLGNVLSCRLLVIANGNRERFTVVSRGLLEYEYSVEAGFIRSRNQVGFTLPQDIVFESKKLLSRERQAL